MNITSTAKYISRSLIRSYRNKIDFYLMSKYGYTQMLRDTDPLNWYIETGRASHDFLGKLIEKKPYMIARKLHEGGSYEDAIQRVKDYIGFKSYEDEGR